MKKVIANTTVENKNNHLVSLIIKGKEYAIKSEFLTEKMFSGKCYMVLTEVGTYVGLDSDYFDEI